MRISETTVTEEIVKTYTNRFLCCLQIDVARGGRFVVEKVNEIYPKPI